MLGYNIHYTVVPRFRVLGFSALPGFRAQKAVDRPSALNPGTTVLDLESNKESLERKSKCLQDPPNLHATLTKDHCGF